MALPLPSTPALPKEQRHQRRMYVDARINPDEGTPQWYCIGEDNDELTRDVSWSEESSKNVLGRVTVTSTREEETIDVDPFYARTGDPLALLLQHFDITSAELDAIKRDFAEAKIDNTGETISAFKQRCDILLRSAGGSSADADNIPFGIRLSGTRIEQDYDFETEQFSDPV